MGMATLSTALGALFGLSVLVAAELFRGRPAKARLPPQTRVAVFEIDWRVNCRSRAGEVSEAVVQGLVAAERPSEQAQWVSATVVDPSASGPHCALVYDDGRFEAAVRAHRAQPEPEPEPDPLPQP